MTERGVKTPDAWRAGLAAALAAAFVCVATAGALLALLAHQVVARGRYPVFEAERVAPAGFLLEWALAGSKAAWLPAVVLFVLTLVVVGALRTRFRSRVATTLLFVLPGVVALVLVALGAIRLRETAERTAAGGLDPVFLPPLETYDANAPASPASPESMSGRGRVGAEPPGSARPDVVLLTVDTLRADHLGFLGYERETAPNLGRLAARGVSFRAAIAPAPMTQHSMAALMTGLPVHSVQPPSFGPGFRGAYLRQGFDLLAERLQQAGYLTAGFVANRHLRSSNGFAQGFETFDETSGLYGSSGAARRRHAGHIMDAALAWLRESAEDDRPRFLWLHVLDPHQPYEPEQPGPWEDAHSPEFRAFNEQYMSWSVHNLSRHLQEMAEGSEQIRPGELEFLVGRYDAEILQVDRHLGRFLEGWTEAGRDADDTLFVVTSDHGEEFYDHGGFLHAHSLFDELIHVPLVLAGPGFEGGRLVDEQVPLLDVMPTILRAAGVEAETGPGGPVAGRPLQAFSSRSADDRPASSFLTKNRVSYRTQDRKLITRPVIVEPGCPDGGDPWDDLERLFRARYVDDKSWPDQAVEATVFDLTADPEETSPVEDPWETHRLLCRFGNYLRRQPVYAVEEDGGAGLSEEDKESLRALGYVVE